MGNRIPKVWTDRQRRSNIPSSGPISSRPQRPRARSRIVSGMSTVR